MSDTTFKTAVSLEQWGRYADCNFGRSRCSMVCFWNWLDTILSINLDKVDKLDIGRYDDTSKGFAEGLLSIGEIIASFHLCGIIPDVSDWLKKFTLILIDSDSETQSL